mmetsp:Transcript_77326/g.226771  ORF Transcript_77326/g.226771 Transcript_77326/m.226771 type:complete len:200 (+) Transcript_77326:1-600(+)
MDLNALPKASSLSNAPSAIPRVRVAKPILTHIACTQGQTLGGCVLLEGLGAVLAADAAEAEAAPGAGGVVAVVAVDPHHAAAHLLGDAVRLPHVRGPDGAAQAVLGAVGEGHALGLGAEGGDGDHRAKNLLCKGSVRSSHGTKHGGLKEVASLRQLASSQVWPLASAQHLCALGDCRFDLTLDCLELRGRNHGAQVCVW